MVGAVDESLPAVHRRYLVRSSHARADAYRRMTCAHLLLWRQYHNGGRCQCLTIASVWQQDLHLESARVVAPEQDAMRRFREIASDRFVNVRYVVLRIPIERGEPAALHLHHDAVPL